MVKQVAKQEARTKSAGTVAGKVTFLHNAFSPIGSQVVKQVVKVGISQQVKVQQVTSHKVHPGSSPGSL